MAHEVEVLGQEHGKHVTGVAKPEAERTVDAAQLAALEQLVTDKIRVVIANDGLRSVPRMGRLLYRLADWGTPDEARRCASVLIATDAGLADYLAGFVNPMGSYSVGDRVQRHTWRNDPTSVQHFLDVDVSSLVPRCETILQEHPLWLTPRRQRSLETFIRAVRHPETM